MKRPHFRLVLGAGAVLGVLLLGIGAVITFNPILLTGYYGRVTITAISINEWGQTQLSYNSITSCNTLEAFRIMTDGSGRTYGSGMGSNFPPFGIRGGGSLHFSLISLEDRAQAKQPPDPGLLAKRILVDVGRTYEVRVDRPLTLYSFTDGEGHTHEGRIEIFPPGHQP
jgi:hypothetical protein